MSRAVIRIVEVPPRPIVYLSGEVLPEVVLEAVSNALLDAGWTHRQVEMLIDDLLEIETCNRLMNACRRYVDLRED